MYMYIYVYIYIYIRIYVMYLNRFIICIYIYIYIYTPNREIRAVPRVVCVSVCTRICVNTHFLLYRTYQVSRCKTVRRPEFPYLFIPFRTVLNVRLT